MGEADHDFADAYSNVEQKTFEVAANSIEKMIAGWDRKGKVLDLGFGAERSIKHLRKLGFPEVIGIDADREMVRRFRGKESIAQMWGNELGFPKDCFDYLSIQNVIQDIPDRETLISYLEEIVRVVKQGGRVLVMNPTPESYQVDSASFEGFPENKEAVRLGEGKEVKVRVKGSKKVFTDHVWRDEDLRNAFEEVGLEVEAFEEPFGDKGIGLVSEDEIPPWMLYELKVAK